MMDSTILKQDIHDFVRSFGLYERLRGTHILVTGGTGLIGSILVKCLMALNMEHDLGIRITCPVRDKEKAYSVYDDIFKHLNVYVGDLMEFIETTNESYDFIFHCASPTVSKYFIDNPVETFELSLLSTIKLLKYAKQRSVRSFVYVSSLECYGSILNENVIDEKNQGYIDPLDVRSSYSMGKRAAETICHAYSKEYGVSVKIARLTQTFGPGVSATDNRVFAQFARKIINGEDIVLHTSGESSKPYCYTVDCITALLYILLKGEDGAAYNVANEDTYCSIKELAYFLCSNFNKESKVVMELNDNLGYAPVTKLPLLCDKLKELGWRPKYGLYEMFARYIATAVQVLPIRKENDRQNCNSSRMSMHVLKLIRAKIFRK